MTTAFFVLALATMATVLGAAGFDGSRLRDLPVDRCAHGGVLREGACECTLNWNGPTCESEVCMNGGRPQRDREGSVRCSCPFGLKGLRCEVVSRCDNGKLVGDSCVCEKGFVGTFCQSRPCHNGTPVQHPGDDTEEWQCTCDVGFTGSFCDTELICMNGGSVSEQNTCTCANGFVGEDCSRCEHMIENGECVPEVSEMSLAGSGSPSYLEWHLIAVVGGTLLVVVLLICAVYFALRSWRTKPSRVSSAQGSAIVPNPEGTDV